MDYTKLGRLFQTRIVSGIVSAKRLSHDRLVERLSDVQFVTRSINQTAKQTTIELQILDTEAFFDLVAGEANRFWMASVISLARSLQSQIESVSWQAVEHYYAAYYAIHYLLRICGVSLSNIDEETVWNINRSYYSKNSKITIPTGLFSFEYESSKQLLTLVKNTKKNSGGSHQDAWMLWEKFLSVIQKEADKDPTEYAATSIDLSTHKSFIIKSAGKYNPPQIRSEINYQFKGGVWVFEKKSEKSIKKIKRLISTPDTSLQKSKADTECLIINNKFITDLSKHIFSMNANSYPRSICRSISHRYPLSIN